MTTNVPGPTFGPTGFVPPPSSAILTGVIADYQAAFGGNLNLSASSTPSLATPQGQLASSTASIIGNVDQLFQQVTQQFDPAYASGRFQDAIGRIYFISRIPSQPTVLSVSCLGLPGVIIPIGALITDSAGNIYASTTSGQISGSGTVILPFSCLVNGPTPIPTGVSIYQAIAGWDAVLLIGGVVGQNVESRTAFEQRRQLSVASNSAGSLPSILGAVLAIPGVLDAYVTENTTNGTTTIGGVNLSPHSLYVAVYGGSAGAIGQAIWSKKAPGCATNGNTTVTVTDSNSGYSPPPPSYQISFQVPTPLQIIFNVNLVQNSQIPSNFVTLVQNAILSAFAGGDGGPRARIGSTIYASRFYAPVQALGGTGANNWVQIRQITIGSYNSPQASLVNGSIGGSGAGGTGTTLSVSSMSGTIGLGNYLVDQSGLISLGTTIVSQTSGPVGGTGTYLVNISQSVPAEAMWAVNPNLNQVPVNINQEPVTAAPIINVITT